MNFIKIQFFRQMFHFPKIIIFLFYKKMNSQNWFFAEFSIYPSIINQIDRELNALLLHLFIFCVGYVGYVKGISE